MNLSSIAWPNRAGINVLGATCKCYKTLKYSAMLMHCAGKGNEQITAFKLTIRKYIFN